MPLAEKFSMSGRQEYLTFKVLFSTKILHVYNIYILYKHMDIYRSEHVQESYHHPDHHVVWEWLVALQILWPIIWGHCASPHPVQAFLVLNPAQIIKLSQMASTHRQVEDRQFLWFSWLQLLYFPTLWGNGRKGRKGRKGSVCRLWEIV